MLNTKAVLNLLVRGTTIVLRFALVFGIGKYYSTEELGVFGLFNTTVTLMVFLLGLDFYYFAHREFLNSPKDQHSALIRDNIIFWLIAYAVICPLSLLVLPNNVLPINILGWFYVILILEHLSQELYRYFVVFEMQLFANLLLFLRSGAWVIVIAIQWIAMDFKGLELTAIWQAWTIGAAVSVMIGFAALKGRLPDAKLLGPINFKWIKDGLRISLRFFLATIAYKVIEFSDRYFLDVYHGKSAVGVYTFYYNFANVLQTVVFTIVIAELYPKLIQYFRPETIEDYVAYERTFKRQVSIISVMGGFLLIVGIIPVLWVMEKPEFDQYFNVYVVLIIGVTLQNLSFIPHYILYAQKKDNVILATTVVGALINVSFNLVLTSQYGLYGSAISTLVSYLFILLAKFYYVIK